MNKEELKRIITNKREFKQLDYKAERKKVIEGQISSCMHVAVKCYGVSEEMAVILAEEWVKEIRNKQDPIVYDNFYEFLESRGFKWQA